MTTNKKKYLEKVRFYSRAINVLFSVSIVIWYIFEMVHKAQKGIPHNPYWALGGDHEMWVQRFFFDVTIFVYILLFTLGWMLSILLFFKAKLKLPIVIKVEIWKNVKRLFFYALLLIPSLFLLIGIEDYRVADLVGRIVALLTLGYMILLVIRSTNDIHEKALNLT